MSQLIVKDLHVSVEEKEILHGVDLEIDLGKVHALMGPNGAGKSCLANALMGNPKYIITKGQILLDGVDITTMPTNERAKRGLFMSFQYPSEITGVTMNNFLRTAYNSIKPKKMGVVEFYRFLKEKMEELSMDPVFVKRYLNEGFSGGEKKRSEILQLSVLQPKYAILDETDSGLDTDSIKIVADGVNRLRGPQMGVLIITHYYRILKFIVPDQVSILIKGQIVKTGGKELALQIEEEGFKEYMKHLTV